MYQLKLGNETKISRTFLRRFNEFDKERSWNPWFAATMKIRRTLSNFIRRVKDYLKLTKIEDKTTQWIY